jgi:hypothetical protein
VAECGGLEAIARLEGLKERYSAPSPDKVEDECLGDWRIRQMVFTAESAVDTIGLLGSPGCGSPVMSS